MSNQYVPAEPQTVLHPGEHLRDFLEAQELSQAEFADRAGISEKHVSQIIGGKAGISAETALILERVIGGGAELWINLDSSYRLSKARMQQEETNGRAVEWAKGFPLSDLRKRGYIQSKRVGPDTVAELLRFFGVADVGQWEHRYGGTAVQFRSSPSYEASQKAQATYVRVCEHRAEVWDLPSFDAGRLQSALGEIRNKLSADPAVLLQEAKKALSQGGVALVVEPDVTKARLSGAAIWPRRNKAVLALTMRFQTADHLWFSFFHEAAHLLKHRNRTVLETEDAGGDLEAEADSFARSVLVDAEAYRKFTMQREPSRADIERFAETQRLPVDSVVGMLQHDRVLPFTAHNDLKRKLNLSRLTVGFQLGGETSNEGNHL